MEKRHLTQLQTCFLAWIWSKFFLALTILHPVYIHFIVNKPQNLCNFLLNTLYIYNSNLLWNALITSTMYTRWNNCIWKKIKVLTCIKANLTIQIELNRTMPGDWKVQLGLVLWTFIFIIISKISRDSATLRGGSS